MSLLIVDRHEKEDIRIWNDYCDVDKFHSETKDYQRRVKVTKIFIERFLKKNPKFFLGISFGKDSIVLADMFLKVYPETILIFIDQKDNMNPYSYKIRDMFLETHKPKNYIEYSYSYKDAKEDWYKKGRPNKWYNVVNEIDKKYGKHVTGLRPDESGKRKFRFQIFGMETKNSFAPFLLMRNQDIFSYLQENDLPIHPNYAMLGGGLFDRKIIRVAAIGNREGEGNRVMWEKMYYSDILGKMTYELRFNKTYGFVKWK